MSKLSAALLASAAFLALASAAHATTVTTGDISVASGNGSEPGELKIFLDKGTSTTVTGHVGSQTGDPGTPVVTFTSLSTVDAKNGFASIDAVGKTNFKDLTISVPTGFTFNDLEFSTLKAKQITVTGIDNGVTIGTFSDNALSNGLNDLLVKGTLGSVFTSIVLTSTDGFSQIKHFEISGLSQLSQTPLPGALALMGPVLGLGYLALRRRRRPMSGALA
jgi:hypothetical protein